MDHNSFQMDDLVYSKCKRSFDLDKPLSLPGDVFIREFKGVHIFLSPSNASWVVARNMPSVVLMNSLLAGDTISNALSHVTKTCRVSNKQASESLGDILVEIDSKRFYKEELPEDINFLDHPLLLHWYITDYCNFRCRHCYRDASSKKTEGELATHQCISILDQFLEMDGATVTYSGGEALTRTDIFDIMLYGKRRGLRTQVLSNGLLIKTKEIVEKIGQATNRIQISLDGTCSEVNDPVRGRGTFNIIMKALQNLREYAPAELEVSLGVTVTKSNYKDLHANLVHFIKNLGFPRLDVILGKALRHGRAEGCTEELVENYSVLSPVMADIISGLEELGWWNPGRYKRMHKRLRHCSWGVTPTIDSYGNVLMCSFGEKPAGNVLQEPLTDILSRMREIHATTLVESIPKCTNCELKYICGGGCKVRNIKINGDAYTCDCDEDFKDYFYYQMARNQLS